MAKSTQPAATLSTNIRTWSVEKLRETAHNLIADAETMRRLGEGEAERQIKKACVRLLA